VVHHHVNNVDSQGAVDECLVVTNWIGQDVILLSEFETSMYINSDSVEEDFECVVKFDSACSRNMSGVKGRISNIKNDKNIGVQIKGFNGSTSVVDTVGINNDGKMEYYVKNMPSDLVLLCANEYAKEGAAILLPNSGVVLQLSDVERDDLEEYVKKFTVSKRLVVNNRTYEVETSRYDSAYQCVDEEALNSTATRYFNTKIHVTNQEERIMAMLLTGLTFKDIYAMTKENSVHGLPRDLTMQSLNQFSHRYGTSPDILQLARPNLAGNTKGYMATKAPLITVGERIEADYMFSDFNMIVSKKTVKIPTLGGAVAAYVTVDCYSNYMHGTLVKSVANSIDHVQNTVHEYTRDDKTIKTFAADYGVIIQSEYRVMLPAAQKFLLDAGIYPEVGEPYNHDHGNEHIERSIRSVKELILFAVLYVLNNPNFDKFGFTKHEIFTLWGELFNWAVQIHNLKICSINNIATKYEMYHGYKPDLKRIRLLPIFSVLYVLRHSKANNPTQSNRSYWQRGLYTGPSQLIPGAVRVAIKTKKRIKIVSTTVFKGVSDGGDIYPYQIVEHYLAKELGSQDDPPKNDELLPDTAIEDASTPVHNINRKNDINQEPPTLDDNITTDDKIVDVMAILGHTGKPKKKTKMQFKVRWKGYDDSHDSWLPWKDLKNNWVLHQYLHIHNLGRLIPIEHRENSQYDSIISTSNIPIHESRGEANDDEANDDDDEASEKGISSMHHGVNSDQIRMKEKVKQWGTRDERIAARDRTKELQSSANSVSELLSQINEEAFKVLSEGEQSYFVDWSNHTQDSYYYCFTENGYISIDQDITFEVDPIEEEGFRAVIEGVPKNFEQALRDPVWGQAAREEFLTITKGTGTLIDCNRDIAIESIRGGAQVLRLIAVYEEKVREGVVVKKVRLVADGRTHYIHGPTYSSTPNREESMILLHIFASKDWDYYAMDEKRAFLSAPRKDPRPMYANISGAFYEVKNALYGTKDACRDYRDKVEDMYMNKLKCEKLQLCSCIFIKREREDVLLILSHVDDFLLGGSNRSLTDRFIEEARTFANYTEPQLNATKFLGMELSRDKEKRIIKITMTEKIEELAKKYPHAVRKKRNVPMPTTGYIVREHEIQSMVESKKRLLNNEEITKYMAIIGSLIWIQGVRLDIIFAVLYLTWFTKCPRQHHMDMAEYVLGYLSTTKDMPLVLGGNYDIEPIVDADASHGTGPNSRSISGELTRLNEKSGAVSAKSTAQASVKLSSFESELDGTTSAIKTARRVSNIMDELKLQRKQARLRQDNKAMIEFVTGNAMAKGVRHMELRMWYTREEYKKGNVQMEHRDGTILTADKLTKLGNVKEHRKYAADIQGLMLLEVDYYAQFEKDE